MSLIALVDDDRHVMSSMSSLLEAEGHRTQTYRDGALALSGLQRTPPDVAICDVSLPGMDGFELLRRLRRITDLPVIFLTSTDDDIDELIGFKVGADDFIRKPVSSRLLVARINAILRRTQAVKAGISGDAAPQIIEHGKLSMDPERHDCRWDGRPVSLTLTGFRILYALALQPGVIKSYGELTAVICDEADYVEKSTIYSHIKRLRQRLRAVDETFDAIETHFGIGIRLKDG